MFYWDKKDSGFELESQLQTVSNIQEIFIATAFLSFDGVGILRRLVERYNVEKQNITVCLSAEFSDERPAEILVDLDKIANVRIAKSGRLFHPKLYYIKGEFENLLIYGSSNLTVGGFGKNVELDRICKPTYDEIVQLNKFIQFCISQTDKLTSAYIDFYKSQEEQLNELKKIKSKIAGQFKSFEETKDPFAADSYDLTDYYFNYTDYETFFPRNKKAVSDGISNKRKEVQSKLLAINEIIENEVKQLNFYVHWDRKKITTLTYPSIYNDFSVEWMGVRYGKRREEIDFGVGGHDISESFPKHACLQCDICSTGFEVVLFFAVRNDAYDRKNLTENLIKNADKINTQVQAMKGYGLEWKISGCDSFSFDKQDDLVAYLRQNDREGRFSSLNMHFAPNDPRIKTLQGICEEVLKGFKLLKPLYDLIVWRGKIS